MKDTTDSTPQPDWDPKNQIHFVWIATSVRTCSMARAFIGVPAHPWHDWNCGFSWRNSCPAPAISRWRQRKNGHLRFTLPADLPRCRCESAIEHLLTQTAWSSWRSLDRFHAGTSSGKSSASLPGPRRARRAGVRAAPFNRCSSRSSLRRCLGQIPCETSPNAPPRSPGRHQAQIATDSGNSICRAINSPTLSAP